MAGNLILMFKNINTLIVRNNLFIGYRLFQIINSETVACVCV